MWLKGRLGNSLVSPVSREFFNRHLTEIRAWISNHIYKIFCGMLSFINILRPGQNGHHSADDIFKRIFFNENVWISIKISMMFVLKNITALVQIIAWCRPGDKPLSEPMMVGLPTHMCVTLPQWVNTLANSALDLPELKLRYAWIITSYFYVTVITYPCHNIHWQHCS